MILQASYQFIVKSINEVDRYINLVNNAITEEVATVIVIAAIGMGVKCEQSEDSRFEMAINQYMKRFILVMVRVRVGIKLEEGSIEEWKWHLDFMY